MKIGILTFSRSYNFGAILQSYALFRTLEGMGHTVEVIDYRPAYLSTPKPRLKVSRVICRRPILSLKRLKFEKQRFEVYERFVTENIPMTETYYTKDSLLKSTSAYDCIFIGSDQIWNFKYNGYDECWFGKNALCPIFSYAASAGDANFTQEQLDFISSNINSFSEISVREEKLHDFLKESLDIESTVVLDPSLLSNPSIWSKWTEPKIQEPYILTYQGRESNEIFKIAQAISVQLGNCKIIPVDDYLNVAQLGYKTILADPADFISLISNAQCVVTNSFHGIAFSIVCNSDFYCLKMNDGQDERSLNLLSSLSLQERVVESAGDIVFKNISYSYVNETVEKLREASKEYIIRCLDQVNK